jgi:hypothetical protein
LIVVAVSLSILKKFPIEKSKQKQTYFKDEP